MAKPKAIDPGAIYKIRLSKAIRIGRTLLRPTDTHRMSGAYVEQHKDAIKSYELAKPAAQ
jgi:hypothetical protein